MIIYILFTGLSQRWMTRLNGWQLTLKQVLVLLCIVQLQRVLSYWGTWSSESVTVPSWSWLQHCSREREMCVLCERWYWNLNDTCSCPWTCPLQCITLERFNTLATSPPRCNTNPESTLLAAPPAEQWWARVRERRGPLPVGGFRPNIAWPPGDFHTAGVWFLGEIIFFFFFSSGLFVWRVRSLKDVTMHSALSSMFFCWFKIMHWVKRRECFYIIILKLDFHVIKQHEILWEDGITYIK